MVMRARALCNQQEVSRVCVYASADVCVSNEKLALLMILREVGACKACEARE